MGWKYYITEAEARDGSRVCRWLFGGHRYSPQICSYAPGMPHVHCERWFCHANRAASAPPAHGGPE